MKNLEIIMAKSKLYFYKCKHYSETNILFFVNGNGEVLKIWGKNGDEYCRSNNTYQRGVSN